MSDAGALARWSLTMWQACGVTPASGEGGEQLAADLLGDGVVAAGLAWLCLTTPGTPGIELTPTHNGVTASARGESRNGGTRFVTRRS